MTVDSSGEEEVIMHVVCGNNENACQQTQTVVFPEVEAGTEVPGGKSPIQPDPPVRESEIEEGQLAPEHRCKRTRAQRRAQKRAHQQTIVLAQEAENEHAHSIEGMSERLIRRMCAELEGGYTVTEDGIQLMLKIFGLMQPFLRVHGSTILTRAKIATVVGSVVRAYRIGSQLFDEADAQKWGDGFSLREQPDTSEDERRFHEECGGSLEKLCELKQAAMEGDRLSLERIAECLPDTMVDDPSWPEGRRDREMLQRVAQKMDLPLPVGFESNQEPPPIRAIYRKVAPAVNKQMYAQYKKGLLILLETATAKRIPGVHFSATSWAPKKGVEAGRPIGDPSNAPDGTCALNSIDLHGAIEELWGPIKHPTLEEICLMILRAAERHGWDHIELWKMDLKAAFTLMFFKPEVVKYLAFELTEDLTMFHIAGFFGWTGTPFAFEAVTRVLRHLLGSRIAGEMVMYVDDSIAVSHSKDVGTDMATSARGMEELLGSRAVAHEKSERGRNLDGVIGWHIDLSKRTVTMSTLNLAKTIYAFFTADETQPLEIKVIEGLASRASRCAEVCRAMRPYKAALYDALRGKDRGSRVRVTLGKQARVDIWMWRLYLTSIACDPLRLERPIESFRQQPPDFVIQFDASLEGYGIGISTVPQEGATGDAWSTLIAYTAVKVPFNLEGKSHYQNNCEFVAVIIGMWLAGRMGFRNASYVLKGDSISALQWAKADRAESMICRRASICFSLLSIQLGMRVAEAVHVPGAENIRCDGLSRGKSGAEVGLPAEKFREFTTDREGYAFLLECDPMSELGDLHEHVRWLEGMHELLVTLV